MNTILYLLLLFINSSIPTTIGSFGVETINSDTIEFSNSAVLTQTRKLHFQATYSANHLFGEDLTEDEKSFGSTPFLVEKLTFKYYSIREILSEIHLLDVILFEADNSPPAIN